MSVNSWHWQREERNIHWKAPKTELIHSEGGMGAVNCNIHRTHLSESLSTVSSHFTPDSLVFYHCTCFCPFPLIFYLASLSSCLYVFLFFILSASFLCLDQQCLPRGSSRHEGGVWLRPEGTVGQGRAGLRACINRERLYI